MRNRLQRLYGRGDLHFVTFSCYRRRPLLGKARARYRFVQILDQVRSRHGFQLIGYVVMPEHVHLLLSEPKKGNPSKVLQVIKQRVSRALRKGPKKSRSAQLILPFPPSMPDAPAFWQQRFYDFNVWSEKKLRQKLDYMHRNPVQRKLVLHPKDWPWSSWSHYEKRETGLIRIDTLGTEEIRPANTPKQQRQKPHPYKSKGAAPRLTFALRFR
jgi:putative transposase